MAPQEEDRPTDARAHLLKHFEKAEPSEHPTRWDSLWKEGSFLPWDKGFPNPALRDILYTRVFPHHKPAGVDADHPLCPLPKDPKTGRRRRALVPGCGKGYDVLLLASAGYDAWGLEASEHAVKAAEAYKKEGQRNPTKEEEEEGKHGHKEYEIHDKEVGLGHSRFVYGDFFKDDWFSSIEGAVAGEGPKFDLIYDYTFLSALPPSLRPAWAQRMSQLLAPTPDAALICVEFPTYKPPATGGPPWGVKPVVYEQHLSRPGEQLKYSEDGHIVDERDEQSHAVRRNHHGLVRLVHYQPVHTHEIGKGSDWVSIWRHPTTEERRHSEAAPVPSRSAQEQPAFERSPKAAVPQERTIPHRSPHELGPAPHGQAPHGTAPYGKTLPETGNATQGLSNPEGVAQRAVGGTTGGETVGQGISGQGLAGQTTTSQDRFAQGTASQRTAQSGVESLGLSPQEQAMRGQSVGAGGIGTQNASSGGTYTQEIPVRGSTTGAGYGTAGVGSGTTGVGSGTTGVGSGTTGVGSGTTGVGSGFTGVGSGTTGVGSGTTGVGSGVGSGTSAAGTVPEGTAARETEAQETGAQGTFGGSAAQWARETAARVMGSGAGGAK